jgi:hypothetical protein
MADQAKTEPDYQRWRSASQSAVEVLNKSVDYYKQQASRAKILYFGSESGLLVVAAAIPVTAAFTSSRVVPAVLGGVVVVLTGLRRVFQWRENWLRFSAACGQLETARQLYAQRTDKYADNDRDACLVREVCEIETAETQGWIRTRTPSEGRST